MLSSPLLANPARALRQIAACRCCVSVRQIRASSSKTGASASQALFESADDEADEAALRKQASPVQREEPWTGEESVRAAVTRILQDSYRPLRQEGYKKPIQQPTEREIAAQERAMDDEEPIAPVPAKKSPWDFDQTFRSPHHHSGVPRIHSRLISARPVSKTQATLMGRQRIEAAKEAVVDYATGDREAALKRTAQRSARVQAALRRAMPSDMTSLVEERIQLARSRGEFRQNKYFGKPMPQDEHANNVHLDRTSYLMNRIVKNQGAAPPWIELQNELDAATHTFRLALREAWQRRALRMLSLRPITSSTIEHAAGYRDADWEQRERGYHAESIKQLIELTRRYNALAPYSVRRGYTDLRTELDLCFKESAPLLRSELTRRLTEGMRGGTIAARGDRSADAKEHGRELDSDWSRQRIDRLWPALKSAVRELFVRS